MRTLWVIILVLAVASSAKAEGIEWIGCSFPTLPNLAITYSSESDEDGLLRMAGRPAVPFSIQQGAGRAVTAETQDYHIRFVPRLGLVTVRLLESRTSYISETGNCVSWHSPEISNELVIPGLDQTEEPTTTKPIREDTGVWKIQIDRSSFDDSTEVFLSVHAEGSIAGRFGDRVRPSLHLRCLENTTSLYIVAGGQFLSDIQGYGRVDYRLDQDVARQWRMNASTDNEALGLWSGRQAIPAVRSMFEKSRLRVRLTPFNESPVEFVFPINGIETAISSLREACNW